MLVPGELAGDDETGDSQDFPVFFNVCDLISVLLLQANLRDEAADPKCRANAGITGAIRFSSCFPLAICTCMRVIRTPALE